MSINIKKLQEKYLSETCQKNKRTIEKMLINNNGFFKTETVKKIYLVDEREWLRYALSSPLKNNSPYLGFKECHGTFKINEEKELDEMFQMLKRENKLNETGLYPVIFIENTTTETPFYS